MSWTWLVYFLPVCVCTLLLLFFVLLLLLVLGTVFCLFFFFSLLFSFSSLASFCILWVLGSPSRVWAWACRMERPILGHWAAKESQTPGNINPWELAWRPPSRHQDLALLNCLQAPVLDTPCQTASKTKHSPTHQQTGCLKAHLAHWYTKTHRFLQPCPSEEKDSTHQRAGTVIKSLLSNKSPEPDGFPGKFFQMFREELTLSLKLFQKIAEERIFPSPFYQATTSVTPKPDKEIRKKKITGRYHWWI